MVNDIFTYLLSVLVLRSMAKEKGGEQTIGQRETRYLRTEKEEWCCTVAINALSNAGSTYTLYYKDVLQCSIIFDPNSIQGK
jgi:hypothetical protein